MDWGQHGTLGQHNSLEGWVRYLLGTKLPVVALAEVVVAVRVVGVAQAVPPVAVVVRVVAVLQVVPPVAAVALRQDLDQV